MAEEEVLEITEFKGLRDDKGQKFIGQDYFYKARNINYDDLVGCNKNLAPSIVYNGQTSNDIDGECQFSYSNSDNVIQTINLVIYGGKIYENFLDDDNLIYTGLTPGKCSFSIYQNKLFITNGLDFPLLYDGNNFWQMGAPNADILNVSGNLTGSYYYAETYVTSGGEEILGTISNTVIPASNQVTVNLTIGYTCTSRKLYRTTAGGSVLKLLATIANNTDLTYVDNIADGSLGAGIQPTNKECPKPYFLEVSNDRLSGCVSNINSTFVWSTEPAVEVFDLDAFEDLSIYGNDFSPATGIKLGYSQLVVTSTNKIYLIDTSDDPIVVTLTEANVGCRNGYSLAKLPKNGDFPGGIMFLSDLNDFRLFNGNIAQPIATSLDNLNTENMSQFIRQTIDELLTPTSNIFSAFWDYKYHCNIDGVILVFDIRTQAWSTITIQTESYSPLYNYMAIINNRLYVGQKGASIVEEFYALVRYRDEELTMFFQTPQMLAGNEVKYFKNLYIYFVTTAHNTFNLRVAIDGDYTHALDYTVQLNGGAFDSNIFDNDIFETDENNEDYRVLFINRWGRWIEFQLSNDDGIVYYRGFKLTWDKVSNKE